MTADVDNLRSRYDRSRYDRSPHLPSTRRIVAEGTSEDEWALWRGWREARTQSLDELIPTGRRLVVLAPHPDDETLTAGGLIHDAAQAHRSVLIVAVTDGESSHPGSTRWPAEELASQRADERIAALAELGLADAQRQVRRIGLADGAVWPDSGALAAELTALLTPDDVLIAPWRLDGHPDHEATCEAGLRAADSVGCQLIQAPIWGWHWASPAGDQMPVTDTVLYRLSGAAREAKRRAVQCFSSQLEPDPSTGAQPVLPRWALRRWLRDREVFLR